MKIETAMKKLNLAKPILKTWSSESHFMSMILDMDGAKDWIANNYVQMIGQNIYGMQKTVFCFFPKHDPFCIDTNINVWNCCPFLETKYVSYNYVKQNFEDIIEYLKKSINQEYYLYLFLKQSCLDVKINKMDIHKTFIYGYDDEKEQVLVADHYDNGRYVTDVIPYNKFKNAFEQAYNEGNLKDNKSLTDKKIVICKKIPYEYKFDLEWFKRQLKDYINSEYTFSSFSPFYMNDSSEFVFGLECYEMIKRYVNTIIKQSGNYRKDTRVFTFLEDHKKMLLFHIKYLINKKILIDNGDIELVVEKLANDSETILLLFMKYIMSGKINILEHIILMLDEMKEEENVILQKILNLI